MKSLKDKLKSDCKKANIQLKRFNRKEKIKKLFNENKK